MTRGTWFAVALAALVAGCASHREPAPVVDRTQSRTGAKPPAAVAAVPSAPAEDTYVVKRGDTLYSIALEHGADYREVAQWNGIDDPGKLRVGQVLRVKAPEERAGATPRVQVGSAPGAGTVQSRPLDAPSPSGVAAPGAKTEPKAVRLPYSKENAAAVAHEDKAAAAAVAAETADFIWPAKGKVIAGFAEPRSKGIDIDGKPGDPIVAAAAGRVTYIGSGIPGLGKLVVIKHDNGFITVYAHNREILVKEQQAVTRGQKIAELGATDADRPKLHFQIRKGAAAVDPLKYLPN
ncbi:MAG: peptidoglycan DD-metalloendopeptidase family protein [Betaproteobacteria bacterium]|nr:peptidoglycan DD-metalloendopeptidase family protein [Betaproteobacteria bacterium]